MRERQIRDVDMSSTGEIRLSLSVTAVERPVRAQGASLTDEVALDIRVEGGDGRAGDS